MIEFKPDTSVKLDTQQFLDDLVELGKEFSVYLDESLPHLNRIKKNNIVYNTLDTVALHYSKFCNKRIRNNDIVWVFKQINR